MSMAVLGLLVERADTVGGIGVRLAQRFPDAHWARSLVYSCVPSLVRQDHARLVSRGKKQGLDRFGATSSGVVAFREWVRDSAVVPPVSRDALQGKLVFSARGDMPALISTVRAELDACRQKYADVHRSYQEARGLSHRSGGDAAEWDALMLRAGAKLWEKEVQRRQELLEDLEGFGGELPESLVGGEAAGG
jgi:hypothetical protein